MDPFKIGAPSTLTAQAILDCQIYKHFEKRGNDFLVYESVVRTLLSNPVELFGWMELSISHVCAGEEHILLLDGVDHKIQAEDRKWISYVVPQRDGDDTIDLGWWDKKERNGSSKPVGVGHDEVTYRHPNTNPQDDEQVPHVEYGNTVFSPITTKASNHLRSIAFVGDEATDTFGRLIACYKNQLSVRVDNSRRCLNYDCYEYKPRMGDGRILNEDANHLPDPSRIRLFDETMKVSPIAMTTAESSSVDQRQAIRSICHIKALTADFCNSRCYRVRVPLDNVVGIRLLQDYRDPAFDPTGEVSFDDYDVAGVLVLELSQPPNHTEFAVRTVAGAENNNSFRLIGDWTPDAAASQAGRHYIYGGFAELRELAAHLCVIDDRIASFFQLGGGSLQGDDLGYECARTLIASQLPRLAKMDEPKQEAFNGDITYIVECVRDSLDATSSTGNHRDSMFIAETFGI